MFTWNVDMYLQDYTASHPRRLLVIFIVVALRTSNLLPSSVNRKKGCLWNLVIRTEGGGKWIPALHSSVFFQPKSTLWYTIKAPVRQGNMPFSLKLKIKKKITLKGFTLFESHFRRNLLHYSNPHSSYYFYIKGLETWGVEWFCLAHERKYVRRRKRFSFSSLYLGCFHRRNS